MNPDQIPTIPGLIVAALLWCVVVRGWISTARKDRR